MSKILIIADLHLDMWLATGRDPLAALDRQVWAGLEALILAGDLSNKPKVRWPKLLAHVARYIAPDPEVRQNLRLFRSIGDSARVISMS
jgi:predicted phosphodiesterase